METRSGGREENPRVVYIQGDKGPNKTALIPLVSLFGGEALAGYGASHRIVSEAGEAHTTDARCHRPAPFPKHHTIVDC